MTAPLAFFQAAATPQALQNLTFGRITTVVFLLLATWLVIRYASQLLHALGARTPRARFAIRWFEPVMRISLWFGALFLAFELLAPSQETFLAGLGSAALAVGLGAQDLIKNFVGGLVVLADRPYQLGDRVKVGEAYGEIDHIGLRSTKLTTPDDTRVTIPNLDIMNKEVFNASSGVPDCQVVADLFLPVDTNADLAARVGREAAYTSPYLHLDKPVVVLVSSGFDRNPYLRLRVKAYVHDHRNEPRMISDITARAQEEFLRRRMVEKWPGPGEG